MGNHICQPGESWILFDARGIPVARVCDDCHEAVIAKYRPEIFTDPGYDTMGERVDEDY